MYVYNCHKKISFSNKGVFINFVVDQIHFICLYQITILCIAELEKMLFLQLYVCLLLFVYKGKYISDAEEIMNRFPVLLVPLLNQMKYCG